MGKQPKPLTPKMLAVLSELGKPDAAAIFMRYMGSFNQREYYYLTTTMAHCTAQIRGLLARRFAECFDEEQFGDHKVRISAAGRKFHKRKAKP